jgi:hypothetical protein
MTKKTKTNIFKIRDKDTGLFLSKSTFNRKGKCYNSKKIAQRIIDYYMPSQLEVVEFELVEVNRVSKIDKILKSE